jgi:hypothetical protein
MLGRYSNQSDQGLRLQALLDLVPTRSSGPDLRTAKRICKRLTEVEVEELVSNHAVGIPIDQLVERFQVHQTTVQKYVRLHWLPRRSAEIGSKQLESIRLYRAGRSVESIAAEL